MRSQTETLRDGCSLLCDPCKETKPIATTGDLMVQRKGECSRNAPPQAEVHGVLPSGVLTIAGKPGKGSASLSCYVASRSLHYNEHINHLISVIGRLVNPL